MSIVFSAALQERFRDLAEQVSYSLSRQGKLLQFKKRSNTAFRPISLRGRKVIGFSQAARLRLLRFVATIDWQKAGPSLFVTLTYPDECCAPKMKERNQHRFLFHRYVEKFLGRPVSGIWRVEWQIRKSGENKGWLVPHFHLMLFGVRFIDHKKIRLWWRKVLGVTGPLCTDVKAMKEGEKTAVYLAKYMSKETSECSLDYALHLNNSGRHYGFTRKGGIPRHPIMYMDDLTSDEIQFLCEFASEHLPWYDPKFEMNFSLFAVLASDVWQEIIKRRLTRMA